MKYDHRIGIVREGRKTKKIWAITIPVMVLGAALYGSATYFSPLLPPSSNAPALLVAALSKEPASGDDKLYVPQLGLILPITTGDSDSALASGGVWLQTDGAEVIDPTSATFAANLHSLGFSPAETRQLSPFYHLTKLPQGSEIYADIDGKRYAYVIATGPDATMTLAACDDSRDQVAKVTATPRGEVAAIKQRSFTN